MNIKPKEEHVYEDIEDIQVRGKGKEKDKKNKHQNRCCLEPTTNELKAQIDELQGLLDLKKDILERTDRNNSKLYEENRYLKNEIKILVQEKESAENRLRCFGCKVEHDSMQPDHRALVIGDRWNSLYKREWNALYEEFSRAEHCHKEVEKRLLEITEWCYLKCSRMAEKQTEKLLGSLGEVAAHVHFNNPTTNGNDKSERISDTLKTLLRYVQHLRTDAALLEEVQETCLVDYKASRQEASKRELIYIERCCAICWLMRTAEPCIVIKYKGLEGTEIDSSTFDKLNFHGTRIENVIWPALLLHENGPLISHGLVRTYSETTIPKNVDEMSIQPLVGDTDGCMIDKDENKTGIDISADEKRYLTMKFMSQSTETMTPMLKTPKIYTRQTHYQMNQTYPPKENRHDVKDLSKPVPAKLTESFDSDHSPPNSHQIHEKKTPLSKSSGETFVSYL